MNHLSTQVTTEIATDHIQQELSFATIEQFSPTQLDSIINAIRDLAKSHRATRDLIETACCRIFELHPSYQVNLKSCDSTLLDFVDDAINTLCHTRDEQLRHHAMQAVRSQGAQTLHR